MRVIVSTSYFSTNAAVVVEGTDKLVSTNYEITTMTMMESGVIVFIDGGGSLNSISKNGTEQRIMDSVESMLTNGPDQLIAASNRHLHFFVCRQGEFKFLKKIKIIAGDDENAPIVDLASNRHGGQGHSIVSIDARGHARVTSLQSNATVKLEQLKHCDKPHQVRPITDQRRQFMFVCSRNIALVDITEKKTIKSSGIIHDDKITHFRCSPVNFQLGCTTSLDKTLKLIDNQKCTVLSCLPFDNPISCARFINASSLHVGTLAGTIHEYNVERNIETTIIDTIKGPVSDLIQLDATFEYEEAASTPTTNPMMTPQLNMSNMSTDSDSSCMTPGFMANIKMRTPLAEMQQQMSPLSRLDQQPRIQSTPAQKTASSRAFFPSPAKQSPIQSIQSNQVNNQLLEVMMELRNDMKEIKQSVTTQAERVNQVELDMDLLKKCLVPPALQQPGPESEHEWTHHKSSLSHWHTPKQHNFYGGNFGDSVSYNQQQMANALLKHSKFAQMRDQIELLANEAQERSDNRRNDENQNHADIGVLDERLHRVESQIQRAINVNGGRLMAKRWHGPSLE